MSFHNVTRTRLVGLRAPAVFLICCCTAPVILADVTLTLLPGEVKLSGPQAYQTLLAEESRNGQYVGQLADGLTFESSNPQVVTIDEGVARPIGNGQATITV